ncbi:MAG: hypothetical protein CVV64_03140 [Candidatus Wallbacteria bacterium HGW-Wallbacteria-1]|jgi:hypothetical protein|uniref:Outer membrane protein beta-barrel domain-containing protein n=1 Tax=Candidatus Wallbacteria bacterium HGW-Wallbacteria-1 TaxID=2013854 RepID=A0A2N1PTJ5_9BACT|nr:MAG: hypothetical protein CVV64_03140 [Candidatus Wallbacteria bacterium HGW-Wallbacteria-1]
MGTDKIDKAIGKSLKFLVCRSSMRRPPNIYGAVSVWVFIALIATGFSYSASDPYDMAGRLEWGMHAGYSGVDSLSGDVRYLDSQLDWGGTVKYHFAPTIAIGVCYRRWNHDDDYPDTGFYGSLASGPGMDSFDEYGRGSFELAMNGWDISLYHYFGAGKSYRRLKAFVMGGATLWEAKYEYSRDPSVVAIIPGNQSALNRYPSLSTVAGTASIGAGIDGHDWADFKVSGNAWGAHIGGGLEFWFDQDFSVRMEGRYQHGHMPLDMAPDLVAGVSDQESLDLSGWYYGMGFNYHFPLPGSGKSETVGSVSELFPY